MTAKLNINAKPRFEPSTDSRSKAAIIHFLHAEKARVNRSSLASRDVTLRQVL